MDSPSPAQSYDAARTRVALGALLSAIALALGLAAFRALFDYDPTQLARDDASPGDVAFFSPTGNAPFFVYAIAGWLFWERRHAFFAALGAPAHLPLATVSMLGAAGFVGWSTHTASPDLLLPGLALGWIAVAALVGGSAAARACWLPAAALLALVPVPAVWIHHLVYPLQLATAQTSVALLGLLGFDAVQVADRLIVERRQVFQVIESCSGLRATQTIGLSALLYGQIFRRSRRHWLALLALSPLLGLLINELRVMSLIFNPYSSFAAVHSAQGLAMLVVGILSIAGVDRMLLRVFGAAPKASASRRAGGPVPPSALPPRRLALVVAVGALLLAASFVPRSPASEAALPWEPADLPIRLDGWKSQPLPVDRVFLGSSQFSEDTFRLFTRGDEQIRLFVGMTSRAARPGTVQTPKTISLATQQPSRRIENFVDPRPERGARAFNVLTSEGRERVLRWHVGVCSVLCEGLRSLFALDRSGWQREGVAFAVRLSTPFPPGAGARESLAADARLLEFAESFEASVEATRERTRHRR